MRPCASARETVSVSRPPIRLRTLSITIRRASSNASGVLSGKDFGTLRILQSFVLRLLDARAPDQYNKAVIRLLAIVLLSAINFPLTAPAFSADAQWQLPPCCRAFGKHKCMMKRTLLIYRRAECGPSLATASEKCPFSCTFGVAATSPQFAPPAAGRALLGAVLRNHQAIVAPTEARFRIPFSRSRQKRGPPSLLS